jgi:hypothetical protein
MEAVFGLVGVLIGAAISWGQAYWFSRRDAERAAQYLAVRIVCIFDKFLEDCVSVVKDKGMPGQDGTYEPQEKAPDMPSFPNDIDWKCIDHNLMYEILSFPSDIEAGDNTISFIANEVASPPDYDEFFEERAIQYVRFGLRAHKLASELREKYDIPPKKYDGWNPVKELNSEFKEIQKRLKREAKDNAEVFSEIQNKDAA